MPDHAKIYSEEAAKYELLISKQPVLDAVIGQVKGFDGLDIVDLGAGTGRLAAAMAPRAKSVVALDASRAMLDIAAGKLARKGLTNWSVGVADHRKLPLDSGSADLVVSGWSISYLANSGVPDWESNLREIIAEMKRVLRPGGTIVIMETMGTGAEVPDPPAFLRAYYAALTEVYGFSHQWIRTDYEFEHIGQAAELAAFFFGDELAERVLANCWVRLPECAGIWWLHL
ncbi:MAG: SAM-dependent methyltransferase [Paenibacillus sp.]|nr:SAM-dependent methyltransferase [Paenibacillus sp.]